MHRGGVSRRLVWIRRIVALALLAGGLAAGVWVTTLALDAVRDEPPPPPPRVTAPPPKPLRIIFPEGFTRVDMGRRITAVNRIAVRRRKIRPRLSARTYLAATARHPLPGRFAGDRKPRSLEGFLFPSTYDFVRKTTSKQLVAKQLQAFQRNWRRLDLAYARSRRLTSYDVVIIASMIEKEVRVPRERALVAAVIYNRLRAGIPLGIDATIRYGLDIPATEAIRQSQLENRTPYNSRIFTGLPPTPIANPGFASLQAATRPARVDYLFFVRKSDCKSHFFTADEDEFFARVAAPRC